MKGTAAAKRLRIQVPDPCSITSSQTLQHEYFGSGWELLQHLYVVHQTRALVQTLLHTTVENIETKISSVCQRVKTKAQHQPHGSESCNRCPSTVEALELRQVLQTVEVVAHHDAGAAETQQGRDAVAALREAVYGEHGAGRDVLELVTYEAMDKARLFHLGCVQLMKRLTTAANAFLHLRLGADIGCRQLHEHAMLCVLRNFMPCMRADPGRFLALRPPQLMAVLQHQSLEVESERLLVNAIILWTQHAPATRLRHLHWLLEEGVSLEDLEPEQLLLLSNNPLVVQDEAAGRVVANAYIKIALLRARDRKPQTHRARARPAVMPNGTAAAVPTAVAAAVPLPTSFHPPPTTVAASAAAAAAPRPAAAAAAVGGMTRALEMLQAHIALQRSLAQAAAADKAGEPDVMRMAAATDATAFARPPLQATKSTNGCGASAAANKDTDTGAVADQAAATAAVTAASGADALDSAPPLSRTLSGDCVVFVTKKRSATAMTEQDRDSAPLTSNCDGAHANGDRAHATAEFSTAKKVGDLSHPAVRPH